jgi:hypothetical protein
MRVAAAARASSTDTVAAATTQRKIMFADGELVCGPLWAALKQAGLVAGQKQHGRTWCWVGESMVYLGFNPAWTRAFTLDDTVYAMPMLFVLQGNSACCSQHVLSLPASYTR